MKRGAVDLPVAKLMIIILLIVLLALVILGVTTGGFQPLFERVNSMFDSVLILFGMNEKDGVECVSPIEVEVPGAGLGNLIMCKDYCDISMNRDSDYNYFESGDFRFQDGEIFSIARGKFSYSHFIVDLERAEFYRKVKSEIENKIKSVFSVNGEFNSEGFNKVMSFDANRKLHVTCKVMGYEVIYTWDGENWVSLNRGIPTSESNPRFVPRFYENCYSDGKDVFWGYSKDKESMSLLEKGMAINEFIDWIGDLRNAWNDDYEYYSEKIEELNGTSIVVEDKEYFLKNSFFFTNEMHNVPLFFIEVDDEKIGIYQFNGEFNFYSSDSSSKANYEEVVSFRDSIWGEIVRLNKIYKYLDKKC